MSYLLLLTCFSRYVTCHIYYYWLASLDTKQVAVEEGDKEVSLHEIRSAFEFVPGLFGIVLRGGYLYGAWPRTVLIIIEFKFIVPELWQIVVFCTCRIFPEGLDLLRILRYWCECKGSVTSHGMQSTYVKVQSIYLKVQVTYLKMPVTNVKV